MIYLSIFEGDKMSEKSKKIILICTIILTILVSICFVYTLIDYISNIKDLGKTLDNNTTENIDTEISEATGNDKVISVDEDSSIRIITEYDENMFKGHKSLIFFWASWCSHCQEEYDVVKTAISDYQNQGYNIYVVSHDYVQEELVNFMKNNDFNYEVYYDETRVIRSNINPEASSVPLTYILDENANLIASHDGTITLEQLNKLITENM